MDKKYIIMVMMFLMIFSTISFSNSAEPPSLIIVVPSVTDTVEISIDQNKDFARNRVVDKFFETYHQFYTYDLSKKNTLTIHVETDDQRFSITLEEPMNMYRNIYTLDLENQSLRKGYNRPVLNFLLILVRIVLTLVIEGVVFFILGFRWKVSWRIFIIINLVTLGTLNIWLSSFNINNGYSAFFALIFAEVIIVVTEGIAFLMGVNEKNKTALLIHVILANLLSAFVGGYLITWLPL